LRCSALFVVPYPDELDLFRQDGIGDTALHKAVIYGR